MFITSDENVKKRKLQELNLDRFTHPKEKIEYITPYIDRIRGKAVLEYHSAENGNMTEFYKSIGCKVTSISKENDANIFPHKLIAMKKKFFLIDLDPFGDPRAYLNTAALLLRPTSMLVMTRGAPNAGGGYNYANMYKSLFAWGDERVDFATMMLDSYKLFREHGFLIKFNPYTYMGNSAYRFIMELNKSPFCKRNVSCIDKDTYIKEKTKLSLSSIDEKYKNALIISNNQYLEDQYKDIGYSTHVLNRSNIQNIDSLNQNKYRFDVVDYDTEINDEMLFLNKIIPMANTLVLQTPAKTAKNRITHRSDLEIDHNCVMLELFNRCVDYLKIPHFIYDETIKGSARKIIKLNQSKKEVFGIKSSDFHYLGQRRQN